MGGLAYHIEGRDVGRSISILVSEASVGGVEGPNDGDEDTNHTEGLEEVGGWVGGLGRGRKGGWNELLWVVGGWVGGEIEGGRWVGGWG